MNKLRQTIQGRTMLLMFAMLLVASQASMAQSGQVRAVHLSPGSPMFGLAVGDTLPQRLDRILYGTATQVITVASGLTHVVLRADGDTAAVIEGDLNVPANVRLNLLLLNTPEFIEARTLSFPLGLAEHPDTTYIRVVHAGPDLGRVDVAITDPTGLRTVLQNIPFKSNTAFFAFPRGTTQVDVLRPGTEERIASGQRRLEGGTHSTLFLAGMAALPRLFVMNESDTSRQELLQMLDGQAHGRIVNVLAGSGEIRLAIDTASVVAEGGIGYGEASGRSSFPTGLRRFSGVGALDSDTLFSVILATEGNALHTFLHLVDSPPDSLPVILIHYLDRVIPADSALVRFGSAIRDTARLTYTLIDEEGERHGTRTTLFKEFSDYFSVPVGRITLEVSRGSRVLFRRRGFVDGTNAYTVIATGSYTDSEEFRMQMLRDSDSSRQEPMIPMTEPEGALRIVHVAPNGAPIEVLLDSNASTARTLRFRDAAPLTDDYVDSVAINVARPGRGIAGSFLDTTAFVAYDSLATFFLLSTAQDTTLTGVTLYSSEDDVPDSGRSAVRFLHGSWDAGSVMARTRLGNGIVLPIGPISFMQSTAYVTLPPGRTRVTLFAPGDTTTPILDVEGTLEPNGLYTAIVTGERLEGTLGINLLDDLDEGGQIPMTLFGVPAGVRAPSLLGAITLSVAPNPTAADATLRLTLERPRIVSIGIHDLSGVERISLPGRALASGINDLALPLEALTSGEYIVSVRDASGALVVTTKLTIAR